MKRAHLVAAVLAALAAPAAAPAADLVVASVSATPSSVPAGAAIDVSDAVAATGGAVGGFYVNFYASADAAIATSDTYLGRRWVASLADGATSNATTRLTLPVGLTGSWWIGAIADASNAIVESDETNNAAAGNAVEVSKPDLTVVSVAVTPEAIGSGGTVDVSDTVSATGGGTGGFWVRFYLSTDATITSSDAYVGGRWVSGLPVGGLSTATTRLTLPAHLTGTYTLGAVVDADGGVAESDETNNALAGNAIAIAKPDLAPGALVASPDALGAGGTLAITDSVTATGGATAGFWVRFYASVDEVITTADTYVGGRWIPALAAGATSAATTSVKLPLALNGTRYLGALVDADGGVAEADEGNNAVLGNTITVSKPDLAPGPLSITPDALSAGGTLTVGDSVTASGGSTGGFWVRFYASTDAAITMGDWPIGGRWVGGLAEGATSSATTSLSLPPSLNGTWYVGAMVDADRAVDESDETNNAVLGGLVAVAKADLVVGAVTAAPDVLEAGGTVVVASSATATGGATGGFWIRIYASADATIATSDVLIGSRWVSSLAAGATSAAETAIALPPHLNGTWYVGAIADADGGVAESDETNNVALGNAITVSKADLAPGPLSATPEALAAGDTLTVTSSVTATGGAAGGFWIRFYASTDPAITTADAYLGGRWVSSLASGVTSSAATAVKLPATLTGTWYVGALVDADGAVAESDETNNAVLGNAITISRADLQPGPLAASPSSLGAGGTMTVSDSVTALDAAAGGFWVRFYASADEAITTADTYLGARWVGGLAAGATSSATTALKLPVTLNGTWWIGAVVDADGGVDESDEGNNAIAGNAVAISKPDLTLTSMTATPEALGAGDTLNVADSVVVTGGSTGGFWVRYYASADDVVTTADLHLGGRWVSSLADGATSSATTALRLPVTLNGTWSIGAVVDADGGVAESDEANNARVGNAVTVSKPDLAPGALAATPDALGAGGQITITDSVTATGGATGAFNVYFYLSSDAAITTSDAMIGSRYVSGLAAGATSSGTTKLNLPVSTTGTWYVGAIVDAGGAVAESDEGNNAVAGDAIVVSKPDLAPGVLAATPETLGTGGQLTITDSVTASGGATGAFHVYFYLSSDATIGTSDVVIGSRYVSGLAAGATSNGTTKLTLPVTTSGTWYVGAIVDPGGGVAESDEGNNAVAGNAVVISKPDLAPGALAATPDALGTGGQLTVTDSVTASGGATGAFHVYFYLSSDATIGTSDVVIGSRYVPGLADGATSSGTTKLTLPVTVSGTWYVGAIVDPGAGVAESDEANNAVAGNAVVISKPDLAPGAVATTPEVLGTGGRITVSDSVTATGGATGGFHVNFYASSDATITAADISLGARWVSGLAAGATSSGTTTLTLPVTLSGTWYVGAIVDAGAIVAESDEGNNAIAGNAVAISKPDLAPGPLAAAPDQLGTGGQITITDSVSANGGATGAFHVYYYLSSDPTITTADVSIGSRYVSGLAAGATSEGSTKVTLPVSLHGTWYVGAIVDGGGYVAESDETNNVAVGSALTITKPDLAPGALAATPEALGTGGQITITDSVTATGGATGGFHVYFYLSSDATITTADVTIGSRYVYGLAAGATSEGTTTITLPVTLSGTWYVGAIVDAGGAVAESDEANNAAAGNAIVVSKPDLAPGPIAATPEALGTGGQITVTDSVTAGGGATGTFYVTYYLSSDETITTADVALGSRTVYGLAAGATSAGTTKLNLPVTLSGTWYVGAIVDAGGAVAESDEANNAAAGNAIVVSKPDLVPGPIAATPEALGTGGKITVADAVTAVGGAAGTFHVYFYLSSDETITTADVALGSRTVYGLAAGATSAGSTTLTLPTTLSGIWYVGAIVDAGGSVPESDEANNAVAGNAITITKPDLRPGAIAATPEAIGAGGTVTITESVTASGGAVGTFYVYLYLSSDETITSADTLLTSRVVYGLADGATSSGSTNVALPVTHTGTWYVGAIVDARGAIAESDEDNNSRAGNAVTIAKPDLAGAVAATPDALGAGGTITITDSVTASGGATGTFYVYYYLSPDETITSADTLLTSRIVYGLAAGATSNGTTNVALPLTLTGTRYVGAIVDARATIPESNEENNALVGNAITIAKPDLAALEVAATPAEVGAGATITVTDTVKATGGSAAGFYVYFYLSPDETITTADARIGSRWVGGLAEGATSSGSTKIVLPLTTNGTFHVGAIADGRAEVAESSEENNAVVGNVVTVAKPDLTTVEVAATPAEVGAGATITVTDTVKATGGSTAGFYVYFYLSPDETITTADARIGSRWVSGGLADGATSSGSTNIVLPLTTTGTFHVGAIADGRAEVAESNEENNAALGNVLSIGKPDLAVLSVAATPVEVGTGATITVTDAVRATGGAAAGFYVYFYLSPDETITTADARIGTRWVGGLADGATSNGSTNIVLPLTTTGTFYVGAIADGRAEIAESDEGNNATSGGTITISKPDLAVASLVASPVAVPLGGPIAVSDTVTATGGATAGFYVYYYLSPDPVITAADYRIGTRWVGSLAAGASSVGSPSFSVSTTVAGPYYLGAIVDARAEVAESDEANNATAGTYVQIGPDNTPPQIVVAGIADGAVTSEIPVTVCFDAKDPLLASVEGTLDGLAVTGCASAYLEGDHELVVQAADTAGNVSTRSVRFAIDFTPPEVAIAGVTDGMVSSVASVAPTFSATDLHLATVAATLDEEEFTSGAEVTAEGDHHLVVTATDAAGNEATAEAWFALDRTAPAISFPGISDGAVFATSVTPDVVVAEPHPGTQAVTLDGAPWVAGTAVEGEGDHVLSATATDAAGNAATAQVSFAIDRTAPTLAVVAPVDGSATSSITVEVVATASDDRGLDVVTVNGATVTAGVDGRYVTTATLVEGPNPIEVSARDRAGNAVTKTVTVRLDTAPPDLQVTAPVEGAKLTSGSVAVSGAATDASALEVRVAGTTVTLGTGGAFSTTLQLASGTHAIQIVATDAAGNATTVVRNVTVAAEPPALVISEPQPGFVATKSPIAVRGTATTSAPGALTVTVNGAAVALSGDGFSTSIDAAPGPVTVTVVATDAEGRTTTRSVTGTYGSDTLPSDPPPSGSLVLALEAPADGAIVGGGTVAVSGRVEGGIAPVSVRVAGQAALVNAGYFSAALALVEGDHTLVVKASDAAGNAVYAQRQVSVDHTAPWLAVTRPASSPIEATESPYLVTGTVGDEHLASVTVAGQPASVLAGQFSRAVPLQVGENEVAVVARDAAGNATTRTVVISIPALPPAVVILAPVGGSEVSSPVVHVRARVEATSAVQSVTIGTGPATLESGEWVADVALALGENVISVVAMDAGGLTGSASVTVRYSDVTKEPLRVTGVDPVPGASGVEPNALVSVSFNKPIARDSLAGAFKVSSAGADLAGGYYVAPGAQTVSFVAKAPLPEGKLLDVRVDGVDPEAGPGMEAPFTSRFAVRERRIELSGNVLDAQLQPLEGVLVSVEGSGLSTRTGAEGSWHLFGVKPGTAIVRYEGGALGDGQSLPVVRRRLFVSGTEDTRDDALVMVPVNRVAIDRLDSDSASHLAFGGAHGPLAVDVPAGGAYFEDGKTSGFLTATRIPPYALPVPVDSGRGVFTALWQLSPVGVRVTKPVELTFPNETGLPAGRYAIVYAYDPARHMLERVGLAKVAADGATLATVEPTGLSGLDFFGYGPVTDEQQAWLEANLVDGASPGTGLPAGSTGMRSLLRPALAKMAPAREPLPFLARFFMLPLGSNSAEAFFPPNGLMGGLPQPNMGTAWITGKIRSPQEMEFEIEVPAGIVSDLLVDLPYQHPVTFEARSDNPDSTIQIELAMRAQRGQTAIAPTVDEDWGQPESKKGAGFVTVNGTVPLEVGTTLITAEAFQWRDSRTARLEAKVEELEPVIDPATGRKQRRGKVTVRRLVETDASAASSGISFFSGWPVEVTSSSTVRGVSGTGGRFSVPVFSYGSDQGALACTEVQTGLRWIVQADRSDPEQPKLVQWPIMDGFPVCQSVWGVGAGTFSPVSLLVDMRLLAGSVTFWNRDEEPVPLACDAERTEWDPARHELSRIAHDDVGQTEVYFFKEDDLETPIAKYTMAVAPEECVDGAAAYAEYKRLRFGPSERWTRRDREECDRLKAAGTTDTDFYRFTCEGKDRILRVRLSEGDHLVVFAVNHATGYAGASLVVVPPITTGVGLDADGLCRADEEAGGPIQFPDFGEMLSISRCARQDIRVNANVRMYPPEIDVRVARQVRDEGSRTSDAPERLVRHGSAATVRDEFVHVSTHWRVRLPPEDLDGDGTPNVTDKCPKQVGPPETFGCPDPNNPTWQPPPRLAPPPVAPAPLAVTALPGTGGTAWPYQYSGASPGPAVDPFDADGDGIPDVAYDRDGDGTVDVADRCPTLKGEAANAGCPAGTDSDRDGTPDASEGAGCVLQPGPTTTSGCPDPTQPYWTAPAPTGEADADADGVPDAQDLCPLYPGPASTTGPNGCPSLVSRFDTDEDGTADPDDDCIWQQGPPEKLGCPDPANTEWTPPTPPPRVAGGPGKMLETYCSELTNPTPDEIKICTKLEARLMDVPAGVPPLAGQLVRVTGTSVERPAVAVFPVRPGKGTSNIQAALRLQNTNAPAGGTNDTNAATSVTTNLAKANYYVHVVGNLTLYNDRNGDGRIDPATEIAVSPPAFNEPQSPPQDWKAGLPERALPLKNVYRSMEPDGAVLARFDRDREHEFRVLDVALTSVTASQADGTTRSLNDPEDGPAHAALDGDLSYQMLMHLVAPEDEGRAGTLPGTYQVRLGSDDYGVDCKVAVDATAETLTATCDNAWIFDVLSGRDLVYLGLSMSGNAENVLYRYNFQGLSPRRDLVTAGHANTVAKSITADAQDGTAATLRAISEPALANVFFGPTDFKHGQVRLCTATCSGSDEYRSFDLTWEDGGWKVSADTGRAALEMVPRAGVDGKTLFRVPIPPQAADMPGRDAIGAGPAQDIFVRYRDYADPALWHDVRLGKAEGIFQGVNARAPGQVGVGGVNVADGHLALRHEDFTLPEYAGRVRFERTYNNQDNEVGTLGIGWRHNLEAYVVEERLGRYAMVLEGQSYDFPACSIREETDGRKTAFDCLTDNAHGGTLYVSERPEADATARKHVPDVVFTAPNGVRYRFDRYSQKALQVASVADAYATASYVQELAEYEHRTNVTTPIKTAPPRKKIREAGRRRWVLTAIDDGHGRLDETVPATDRPKPDKGWTVVEYFADSDMIRRAYRKGGKLGLYFTYEPVDLASTVSARFKGPAVGESFGFLKTVEARFQSEGGDGSFRNANPDGTPQDPNDFIVRLTFVPTQDGRRNLGKVERIAGRDDKTIVDQAWEYAYVGDLQSLAPAGSRLAGQELWEATNELEKAELKIFGAVQWRARWERSLTWAGRYPHTRLFEIVDRAVLPGTSSVSAEKALSSGAGDAPATEVKTQVKWIAASKRQVVRADGVLVDVDLNSYGSVTLEAIAGATLSTTWFNEANEKEKVLPSARTTAGGRKLTFEATDKLLHKATTLDAAGNDNLDVAGVQVPGKIAEASGHDARFGTPATTKRATAAGDASGTGAATWSTTINTATGDLGSVTVTSPDGTVATTWEGTRYDAEGVLEEEKDAVGRVTKYEDTTPKNPWGLRPVAKTALTGAAEGAVANVQRTRVYDWLGRLERVYDDAGHEEEWKYDAVGRLLMHRVRGTPDRQFNYSYEATGDCELTVTETLTGVADHRRVSVYRDGLLVKETWAYGSEMVEGEAHAKEALRTFEYQGGRLDVAVDEREVSRKHHYDGQGRLWYVEATDASGMEQEVLYLRDDEGKVTKQIDHNGLAVEIGYDKLGRPARWTYGGASGETSELDVETTKNDPDGRASERTDGTFTWKSKLDALGRVRSVEAKDLASELNTTTDYDGLGRRKYSKDHVLGLEEWWWYDDVFGRLTKYERKIPESLGVYRETRKYTDTPGDPETGSAGEHTVEIEETVGDEALGVKTVKRRKLWLDAMGRTLHTLDYVVNGVVEVEAHRHFEYDPRGNVLVAREPIGDGPTLATASVTSATTAVSFRTYDAAGNLASETDPKGNVTTYVTDAAGLVTAKTGPHPEESWSYAYDQFGQLEEKTLAGPTTPSATWKGGSWRYDYRLESGETVKETDPLGYETRRWYNARHKLLKETRKDAAPGRTQSSNERAVKLTWNGPWLKRQLVVEGTSEAILERGYDHRGRVRLEEEQFTGPAPDAHYTYTTSIPWTGKSAAVTQSWLTSLGEDSRSGRLVVDALENVIERAWGGYADTWTYDAAGQLTAEKPAGKPERRFGYKEGLLTSVEYGTETTTNDYYASGKLSLTRTPDLRERRLVWDARGLLAREEYGRDGSFDVKRYAHDAAGRVETMWHGAGVDEATWEYGTGPRGELYKVVQPGTAGTFWYAYDARGALTDVTPPTGGAAQRFDYDYLGRQILRKRGGSTWITTWLSGASTTNDPVDPAFPGQRSTRRVLDGRGRTLVAAYTGAASDLTEVRTDYDALDQPVRVRETRTSGDVDVTFDFEEARKLLTGITRGAGASAETITYGRTTSGQLEFVESPAGRVTYGYDALDRLHTIAAGTRTTTLTWDDGGQRLLDLEDDALAVHECRRYDGRGRVRLVASVTPGEACEDAVAPIVEFTYGYDDRGNRTSEAYRDETLAIAETTAYGYDKADRLTGVLYPSGTAKLYSLAGDGTRLGDREVPSYGGDLGPGGFSSGSSGVVQTYAYDTQGALDTIKDADGNVIVDYTVDAAGRVRAEVRGAAQRQYTWDAASRIAKIDVTPAVAGVPAPTESFTYRYDFAGRRILKSGGVGDTRYLWGADGLAEEISPAGTRLLYERAGDLVIAAGGYRVMHDALDSVVGRMRWDGTPVLYRYDAWGEIRSVQAPATGEPSLAYAGQHWDADVALSYAQQRWYDPRVGRFLSEDPLGVSDERLSAPSRLLTHGYAAINPAKWTDRRGLDAGQAEYLPREYDTTPPDSPTYDAVTAILVRRRPGDVIDWWNAQNVWSLASPLTDQERAYLRMTGRGEVSVDDLTPDDIARASEWFGDSDAGRRAFATTRTRRQIVTHYVYHHPATTNYLLGTYRLGRDFNPLHLALERGWQVGGGKEMFTGEPVSRAGAMAELALAIGIMKGTSALLKYTRPADPEPFFHEPPPTTGRASSRLVSYGSDELSQEAIRYRIAKEMWGGRNVAVFEYEVGGETKRLVISSRGPTAPDLEPELAAGFGHAEQRGIRVLKRMGVADKVKRVYTELEPCMAPGGYCANRLLTDLPNVPVTYSFPYSTPSDGASVGALKGAAGQYKSP